jgi:hypothetical protein
MQREELAAHRERVAQVRARSQDAAPISPANADEQKLEETKEKIHSLKPGEKETSAELKKLGKNITKIDKKDLERLAGDLTDDNIRLLSDSEKGLSPSDLSKILTARVKPLRSAIGFDEDGKNYDATKADKTKIAAEMDKMTPASIAKFIAGLEKIDQAFDLIPSIKNVGVIKALEKEDISSGDMDKLIARIPEANTSVYNYVHGGPGRKIRPQQRASNAGANIPDDVTLAPDAPRPTPPPPERREPISNDMANQADAQTRNS